MRRCQGHSRNALIVEGWDEWGIGMEVMKVVENAEEMERSAIGLGLQSW